MSKNSRSKHPVRVTRSLQASSFLTNIVPIHKRTKLCNLHARLDEGAVYNICLSQYLLYVSLTIPDQYWMPNLLPDIHDDAQSSGP